MKTNNNDAAGAQPVYESMCRLKMRIIEIGTAEQQTTLLAHRVTEQLIKQRIQMVSVPNSFRNEIGVACPKCG